MNLLADGRTVILTVPPAVDQQGAPVAPEAIVDAVMQQNGVSEYDHVALDAHEVYEEAFRFTCDTAVKAGFSCVLDDRTLWRCVMAKKMDCGHVHTIRQYVRVVRLRSGAAA